MAVTKTWTQQISNSYTFSWSGAPTYYQRAYFDFSQETNVDNNTSTIKLTGARLSCTGGYSDFQVAIDYINLDGVKVYAGGTWKAALTGADVATAVNNVTFPITLGTVTHDSNGNKSITIKISATNFSSPAGGYIIKKTDTNETTTTLTQIHKHSYTSSVTKQPTCTATGTRTYTCACGNSYTESIAATGHKYSSSTVAATCTTSGYTKHTCSVCGNSYTDNSVAALGHNYNTITFNSTCTENGYTEHTCSRCGDNYIDNYTDALGHNFDGNICLNCGGLLSSPTKQDCYIFDGTKWVKHSCYVGNKRMGLHIYKSMNPQTAALGFAMLGTMRLGEGN